jgi:hypothetical protein
MFSSNKVQSDLLIKSIGVNYSPYRRDFITGLPPCKIKAKIFPVDPEIAWERVMDDLFSGRDRAQVPEETIYRMYGQFLYTVKMLSLEGFEKVG